MGFQEMGDSLNAEDRTRTPHGVRIDEQRVLRLPGAFEDFEKKQAAWRGRKRAADEQDDGLFIRSDDEPDPSPLSPTTPTTSNPVLDASEAVDTSPEDPRHVHDRKRLKPNPGRNVSMEDCTCAISHSCERARRLDVRDCRSLAPAPAPRRSTQKTKKDVAPKKVLPKGRRQGRNQRTYQELSGFMATFRRISDKNPGDNTTKPLDSLRRELDKLPFLELPSDAENSPELARFLDENTGIPLLFDSNLPAHMRLDAEALYNRWSNGDLDHNLLRGIELRSKPRGGGTSRAIENDYRFRKSSDFVGEGHLRNGQWFPYQICALRDGAHGDHEAGISGKTGLGALSIVLSSSGKSNTYADVDEGEEIAYCGTRGKDTVPTAGTNLLLRSADIKNPIRVLRSSKLPKQNKFRPAEGLRYDGLYEIKSKELLDEDTAMYRFKLVRLDNQYPIRYVGNAKRPTEREIEELKSLKNLSKQND